MDIVTEIKLSPGRFNLMRLGTLRKEIVFGEQYRVDGYAPLGPAVVVSTTDLLGKAEIYIYRVVYTSLESLVEEDVLGTGFATYGALMEHLQTVNPDQSPNTTMTIFYFHRTDRDDG